MPKIGSRKLYVLLRSRFGNEPGFPSRDRFVELLGENRLLLKNHRRRRYKTTDSNYPFKRYPNLIRDRQWTAPNQAWASDITYIETHEGVC